MELSSLGLRKIGWFAVALVSSLAWACRKARLAVSSSEEDSLAASSCTRIPTLIKRGGPSASSTIRATGAVSSLSSELELVRSVSVDERGV